MLASSLLRPFRSAAAGSAVGNRLRLPSTFASGELEAAVKQQEIWPGTQTTVWTYGGTYPAPTIRLRSGGALAVKLRNNLDEATNIHWHGLIAPAAMDGHPKDMVNLGDTFDYAFPIRQRAGTYWYHPHPDMATAKQTYMGMAGLFIIEDEEEQALSLPRGDYDVPLVIQDRRQAGKTEFVYQPLHTEHMDGYLGDTVLVNGTPDPYLDVARGIYRFRMLNGSNARIFKLAFDDERRFQLIATDGGLLDKPYEMTSIMLSPGERVEILVDFSGDVAGSSVGLKSAQFSLGDGSTQGLEMPVMRFDVTSAEGWNGTIPSTLSTIEALQSTPNTKTQSFLLTLAKQGDMEMHSINGTMYQLERVDKQVVQGETEIWSFVNLTPQPHPMHLHGVLFQVLDRSNASELEPNYRGWKDTMLVRPNETVRIITKFDADPGVYVFHCHNLEHEDEGMMMNLEILPAISAVEETGAPLGPMNLR